MTRAEGEMGHCRLNPSIVLMIARWWAILKIYSKVPAQLLLLFDVINTVAAALSATDAPFILVSRVVMNILFENCI